MTSSLVNSLRGSLEGRAAAETKVAPKIRAVRAEEIVLKSFCKVSEYMCKCKEQTIVEVCLLLTCRPLYTGRRPNLKD
jgi:hypothetical protein